MEYHDLGLVTLHVANELVLDYLVQQLVDEVEGVGCGLHQVMLDHTNLHTSYKISF